MNTDDSASSEALSTAQDLDRLQTAMDTWEIGILDHNHITGEIYGSPQMRRLYGLTPDELLSLEGFGKALFPADVASAMKAVAMAHDPQGDGRLDLLHRIRRKDGAVRWIHSRSITTFTVVDGERVPSRTQGSMMDMTERHELELSHQRQSERLVQATAASNVGIFEVDHCPSSESDALYWSAEFRKTTGYNGSSAACWKWFVAHLHRDEIQGFQQAFSTLYSQKKGGRLDCEYRFLLPDGRERNLLVRAATTFEEGGKDERPLRTVGALLDITAFKKVAQELRRQTAIFDATPDFVCITDPDGKFVYLNRAGRQLLGFGAEDDLSGRSVTEVHPKGELKHVRTVGLPAVIRDGSWVYETEFLDHEGNLVPMSLALLGHKDAEGRVTHFSAIARDLSREKELEAHFRQSQKMEAIGLLAGGIAHDFNNLLSVILGFAELGAEQLDKSHPAYSCLQDIEQAGTRASSLTRQLLAFSRKQLLAPSVIELGELIKNSEQMFRRLIGANVEYSVIGCEERLCTKADANQIEQVLLNLVVNARDAMPQGGRLIIECSRTAIGDEFAAVHLEISPGDYVVLEVSDTGEGMDAKTCERVFDPFFTTKEPGRGTGLGLSTVFGIVRQSGGGIEVDSEIGQGTTFKLYFPCTDEAVSKVIEPVVQPHGVHEQTILVVEDEPQVRKMAVSALKGAGYSILSASGPIEALSIARKYSGDIHLLLTDVVMPQKTGKELASELLKTRPATKVLYMSGYTEDSIVHHGVLEPDIHFLPKPISAQMLIRSVEERFR